MKTLRDYCCNDCKIYIEDVREYADYPSCPTCGKTMEIYFTKLNYDSYFPGSHNAEYTSTGKKFNNCTKEQLLSCTSYSKRVGDKLKYKKGLKGQIIDDKKHEKRIK